MAFTEPKIGIVGGTGKMGRWFSRLFHNEGLEVLSSGLSSTLSPVEMARQCNVIVISVPIDRTVDVIREIGPVIPEDGLMMDLTSIKLEPVSAMLHYSGSEVVGLHPLFGPNEMGRGKLTVALCPGRGERGLDWIKGVLTKAGFRTVCVDAEEHDKMMGFVQGVNHFSTIALALCLSRSGITFGDLTDLSTRTFLERLDRIRVIAGQPTELFESLLMKNPFAGECIGTFCEAVEELICITRNGDSEAFRGLFGTLNELFDTGVTE